MTPPPGRDLDSAHLTANIDTLVPFHNAFLSKLSKSRKPSPIRDLFPFEARPNMLSMLAGKPNPATFPFQAISFTVRSPHDPLQTKEFQLPGDLLLSSLQYGMTAGFKPLIELMGTMMESVHSRALRKDCRIMMGTGSQDLLYKAFLALVDPGDTILVEAPTYAGILPIIETLNCNVLELECDSQGITPSSMKSILQQWPLGKPRPKLLYTVPYGANPTGITIPESRRREILDLARQYNFLILEDDPYYHLYFGPTPRPPSYFSLEAQTSTTSKHIGRVVRFDTFSKVLAAGLRLGWVTGPVAIIDAMETHAGASSMQPPSISSVMVYTLLKDWGLDGYIAHTETVSAFYKEKMCSFNGALERHLSDLAEWTKPDAGMFFWVKLSKPASTESDEDPSREDVDSSKLIRSKAISRGVLALPGSSCFFHQKSSSCIRISYSMLSDEEMDEAAKRLSEVLREGC